MNAEVSAKLTALMKRYIIEGQSTAGAAQKNDFDLSINGEDKAKPKKKGKKAESAVE